MFFDQLSCGTCRGRVSVAGEDRRAFPNELGSSERGKKSSAWSRRVSGQGRARQILLPYRQYLELGVSVMRTTCVVRQMSQASRGAAMLEMGT